MHPSPPLPEEISTGFYPGFEPGWRKAELAGRTVMQLVVCATLAGLLSGRPVSIWTGTPKLGRWRSNIRRSSASACVAQSLSATARSRSYPRRSSDARHCGGGQSGPARRFGISRGPSGCGAALDAVAARAGRDQSADGRRAGRGWVRICRCSSRGPSTGIRAPSASPWRHRPSPPRSVQVPAGSAGGRDARQAAADRHIRPDDRRGLPADRPFSALLRRSSRRRRMLGAASAIIPPAIAAVSLGLVGRRRLDGAGQPQRELQPRRQPAGGRAGRSARDQYLGYSLDFLPRVRLRAGERRGRHPHQLGQ